MQESNLWKAISEQDDRKAFDRLYLACWGKLYAIAWNRTLDRDTAQELVQEVFVSVWEKRKQISINGQIPHYLSGVLKYRIIDHFRSEQVKKEVFESAFHLMEKVADKTGFELGHEDVEEILEDELKKMPSNMRDSFRMRMNEMSPKEIARKLNLADQTVNNLLTEANKRLKKSLPHRFENHNAILIVTLLQVVDDLLT